MSQELWVIADAFVQPILCFDYHQLVQSDHSMRPRKLARMDPPVINETPLSFTSLWTLETLDPHIKQFMASICYLQLSEGHIHIQDPHSSHTVAHLYWRKTSTQLNLKYDFYKNNQVLPCRPRYHFYVDSHASTVSEHCADQMYASTSTDATLADDHVVPDDQVTITSSPRLDTDILGIEFMTQKEDKPRERPFKGQIVSERKMEMSVQEKQEILDFLRQTCPDAPAPKRVIIYRKQPSLASHVWQR